MFLDLSRGAKLVERALGHAWKDVDHGVDPVLLVPVCKADDLNAEGDEGAIKEPIQKKHLT